jgi:Fe-S-cluster-containing dehydrogenase component
MGLKKLFIDIPAFFNSNVSAADIECEYMFHRGNNGAVSIIEAAEFAVYCRQCKDAFCVDACPREALEHQSDGTIKRYNMRCVGCKSCTLACPFGTIYPEVMNYITSKCNYCLDQLTDNPGYIPACVKTSPGGTLKITEMQVEDTKNNIFFVGEHLAVKNNNWLFREGLK